MANAKKCDRCGTFKLLGWNIRYLRKEKGMSQKQLGAPIGISASSISMWENHKSVPSDIMIERMAYIFDVTAHELRHKDIMLSKLGVSNNKLLQDEKWREQTRLEYLDFLLCKLHIHLNDPKGYYYLAHVLYNTSFYLDPRIDCELMNCIVEVRQEFLDYKDEERPHMDVFDFGAFNSLEVMTTLVIRINDYTRTPTYFTDTNDDIFEDLMNNLNLDKYRDDRYGGCNIVSLSDHEKDIRNKIKTLETRQYSLFPLDTSLFRADLSNLDYTKMSLMTQLSYYVLNNYSLHHEWPLP